jgi:hypothetical protein
MEEYRCLKVVYNAILMWLKAILVCLKEGVLKKVFLNQAFNND